MCNHRLLLVPSHPEDGLPERSRAGRLKKAAAPGQHIIDQRTELIIVAPVTQQRECFAKLLRQLRIAACDVCHVLVVSHHSHHPGVASRRPHGALIAHQAERTTGIRSP